MPGAGSREPGAGSREPGAGSREPGAGSRWATLHPQRVVLAIARTVTSTVRLLDVLELLRSDFRIQVLFAFDNTSAFSPGVTELLARVGAAIVPWDSLSKIDVDLVLTASENVDLDPIKAPVMVFPHGVGFQKYVPDSRGHGVRLSGLVPDRYLKNRDVLLLASHQDQVIQLERISPGTAARTAVVGDLCFDRMLGSRHLRPQYRDHLGVTDSQRLVVISSTWRDQSLWGRWPELPHRLLAELPFDEYRVAMILHPNVWSAHTPWQVRGWLAEALDAGLALIPPTGGWQATVIAADVLIGDHGSVTYYGAALGTPALVSEFGAETVPGTPLADLQALAAPIAQRLPLRPQLEQAIAKHDPASSRYLAGLAFENIGTVAQSLRAILYQRMRLPEPGDRPAAKAWPAPRPETVPVGSFQVWATPVAHTGHAEVVVQRFPVLPTAQAQDTVSYDLPDSALFLVSYDDEPDPALIESAVIVVGRRVVRDPATWVRRILRSYPGARSAAIRDGSGWLVASRNGPAVAVTNPTDLDPVILAVAVLVTSQSTPSPPSRQPMAVRLGGQTYPIELTPVTPRW